MSQHTEIPILTLLPSMHGRIREGHPWVFAESLKKHESLPAGSLVRLKTDYDYDCGLGFYNPHSSIAIRLLHTHEDVNVAFFVNRLRSALAIRQRVFPTMDSYRLCFGESDELPGLIIDRYGDYCAMQCLSYGMDARIDMIIEALRVIIPTLKGVIAKHDSSLRLKEGLEQGEYIVYGEIPDHIHIQEHEIKLEISLMHGQKTGYFLDQRLNRKWVEQLSGGLDVLDCFTNQGGFALHAAKGGAKSVLGIDSAKQAIEASKRNAELNGYSHVEFEQADVFDYLKSSVQTGKTWDMIILDPPAFTKNKATLARAKRGYAEINRQALKLIRPGGFLVSASCSQHLSAHMLTEIVQSESKRVNRSLRLIHSGGQSPCHPILPIMPETSYLKCLTFEVQ
ncbi:MAG: class I SAM-dependent rRNA methyltransferase [Candidatus Kapaibacteriota bacterium]